MSHRVNPGDKSLPAKALNDAFRASDIVLRGQAGVAAGLNTTPAEVIVKNSAGSDVSRFAVLGIDGPIITQADNDSEFYSRVMFDCSEPAAGTHEGAFVVCLEPIADGKFGRAAVVGAVQCQVDVQDADHQFAGIADGDATKLRSYHHASARILWKAAGTGTQWAVVELGRAREVYQPFPVTLAQTGGTAGDASTQCSYTYTVTDADGFQLGTAVNPTATPHTYNRPTVGAMTAADAGVAHYQPNAGGNLQLVIDWANERPSGYVGYSEDVNGFDTVTDGTNTATRNDNGTWEYQDASGLGSDEFAVQFTVDDNGGVGNNAIVTGKVDLSSLSGGYDSGSGWDVDYVVEVNNGEYMGTSGAPTTIELDTADWRGMWLEVVVSAGSGLFSSADGSTDAAGIGARRVGNGVTSASTLDTSAAVGLTFRLEVDGSDSGKLKLDIYGSASNDATYFVLVRKSGADKTAADATYP